ncbi:MAG: hypothetical protein LLF94_08590, partial [Chlamydiales bacterium]|nr:hypothetical protein [Chlamydiales bacterium]
MRKFLFWIAIGCVVLSGGVWLYEEANDGFYESAIHLHTWPKKKYDALACAYNVEDARIALNQPVHYLGQGRQFFDFESADGKYVLKFLKCQRIDVSSVYKAMWLPKYFREKRKVCLKFRQERVDSIFAS